MFTVIPKISYSNSQYWCVGSWVIDADAGDYFEFKGILVNNVNIYATTAYAPLVTVTRLGS